MDINHLANKNMSKINGIMKLEDDFKKFLSIELMTFTKIFSNIN